MDKLPLNDIPMLVSGNTRLRMVGRTKEILVKATIITFKFHMF